MQLFGQNLTAALNVTYFCCVLEQESLANVTSTWAESPPYPVWISSRSFLLHHDSHLSRICVRKHVLLSVDRCSSISLQTLDLSFTCGRCGIYTCRHINVQVHLIIPLPRNKLYIPFSFSHFRFQYHRHHHHHHILLLPLLCVLLHGLSLWMPCSHL